MKKKIVTFEIDCCEDMDKNELFDKARETYTLTMVCDMTDSYSSRTKFIVQLNHITEVARENGWLEELENLEM